METTHFQFGRGKHQTFKKRNRTSNTSDDDQQLLFQEQQQDQHLDNPIDDLQDHDLDVEEQDFFDDIVLGDDDEDFVPPTLVEVETFADLPYVKEEETNLTFHQYIYGATLLQGGKTVINYKNKTVLFKTNVFVLGKCR